MHDKNQHVKEDQFQSLSLKKYILGNRSNRWLLGIGVALIILQLVVFKLLYPFAGFINGDSYVYLETAYHNLTVNTYPIGYSKFLRLISVFSRSDTVVVALQFLLLHGASMALLFTLFYFYAPAKLTRILLFIVTVGNPVFLYLANYISSDSFFLSLSLIWFTLLIWIMNRPTRKIILINSVVLFVAFTVRYNALFYPVVGVVALILTKRKVMLNLIGFGISLFCIVLFIHVSSAKYKKISGWYQFTPFTGWQMANNALYAYRYVDSSDRKISPPALRQIDNTVRAYFDSSRDVRTHPQEAMIASTVYMWAPNSPLTIFMENQFRKDSTASALKRWASVAPLMKEYGFFLMKTYPKEFIKYYLIPNALKYYVPPVEFLDHYSTGVDSVNETAQAWFGYSSKKIRCNFKDFKVNILNFYPVLVGTTNVILVLSAISFFLLQGYKYNPRLMKALVLVAFLWVINFIFSVFASPIALRFQLFPILVSFSFAFLLVEFMIKAAKGSEETFSNEVEEAGMPKENAVTIL